MNNIAHFPGFVDYPKLDVTALRQAASGASNATIELKNLFIQTQYLPTLYNRVIDVDSAIRSAHYKMRDVIQTLDISIGIKLNVLRQYQAELESAHRSEVEEILEDINVKVAEIIDAVNKNNAVLNRMLAPMKQAVDRASTEGFLAQLSADQERLPLEIDAIKERQQTLEQKRKALTEAMALIENKGFAQLGKDTILSAQELAKLGIAGPEVAIVEKGIELAHEALEKLENATNYFNLIEARNKIRKQINDLITLVNDKNSELRLSQLRSRLIQACHQFDEHREAYIGEFMKLILGKQSFLDVYRAVDVQDQDSVRQFAVDALALIGYLKAAV